MQHNLAEYLAKFIINETDSEYDRTLTVYGIEVFLNEFLKATLIFILGVLTGNLIISMLSTFFVLLSRKIIQGRHFSNNVICTFYSVFTCFIAPVIFLHIDIPVRILYASIGIILLSIIGIGVYYNYHEQGYYVQIIVYIILLLACMGIAYFSIGINAIGSIMAVQICTEIMWIKRGHPDE
ncbi:Accessory gene regulator B [Pseudobutyrivibrio sp. YE44]|uniref:accessory gene regulator B family protein n=1 Tax=Pseudobutyrivibrio sp. YE44 TaxID=1520802 RepID=UPI000890F650|nr:accessory gene regulator B family protein [Pseudobutyrivibrio sp. YE44]SDB23575.1 Accessory gene regulator B [Pseudobutyrivibrio sp. YE44]